MLVGYPIMDGGRPLRSTSGVRITYDKQFFEQIHLAANLRNTTVKLLVTFRAEPFKVPFLVVPEMSSGLKMVYLEVLQAAAVLAARTVAIGTRLGKSLTACQVLFPSTAGQSHHR